MQWVLGTQSRLPAVASREQVTDYGFAFASHSFPTGSAGQPFNEFVTDPHHSRG